MNIRNMLKTVLYTPGLGQRWGIPTLIEGQPGSAKTSIVRDVSAELGLAATTIIASLREPADFLGISVVIDRRVRRLPADEWIYQLSADDTRGTLFFDEMNTAPPSVQAAMLRVVLDGCVGDVSLSNGVRIVAAQNAVEDGANAHDLAAPLANRFLHWKWSVPTSQEWSQWLIVGDGNRIAPKFDGAAEEIRVMDAWPAAYARAAGQVSAFVRRRPELLHKKPAADHPDASRAWPSHRTWTMATHVIAGAQIHGLEDCEANALVAGCVGEAATQEFFAYCAQLDLPDLGDLLDGKIKWQHDARLDRTMAVLNGCAALVIPPESKRREKRAKALFALINPLMDTIPDVCQQAWVMLINAQLVVGDDYKIISKAAALA